MLPRLSRHYAIFLIALSSFVAVVCASSATSAVTPVPATSTTENGPNPALQMIGYVKDSIVRTIDGVGLMWKNYGRCNDIRSKQKKHRDVLRSQWEGDGLSNQEIKQRLKGVNGGITYDEFAFLVKGREDRGKLTQLVLLSWGAPRFLPYALMFYPEMLPSAFSPKPKDGASVIETMSRKRSHAVLKTLMNLETDAHVVPPLAKLNIFGRKRQQQVMEDMQRLGEMVGSFFVTPVANTAEGADVLFSTLQEKIYSPEDFDVNDKRLVRVPKSIIKGLSQTLDGSSALDAVFPHFITRGKVLNHIKKVTESDEFLIDESVEIEQLGKQRLMEACKDRLIGENGRTEEELRESLQEWLNQVVVAPRSRVGETGEYYNGNMARAAMMCFHAMQAAKDQRSASQLPRLLFTGPTEESSSGKSRFFSK